MTQAKFEELVEKNMRVFACTREEAEQIVRDDEIIDKGGKCDWEVEMTPEQKKVVRSALRADREASTTKRVSTRAANPDKRDLIQLFNNTLSEYIGVDSVVVTNAEREITFTFNGTNYKITLSAPRS